MVRKPLTASYAFVHAYSSFHQDAISFSGNQASLASVKDVSAGVVCERRFMLKELTQYNGGLAFPTNSGVFGFTGGYAGNQLYNESQLGLAYGRSLGKLAAGIQFNYYRAGIMGYGHASSVNFEAGAILHVNDQLNAGIHIYNPTGSRLGKNGEERLPVVFSMGMGYDVSGIFFIGCLVEKTEDQPVTMNTGLQYCFAEKLFARTGISTATSSFYFGAGYILDQLRIDATVSLQQQAGFSPGLMLIYNITEK